AWTACWRRCRCSPSARSGLASERDAVPVNTPRSIAVLGATGSIGASALDVIGRHPGRMRASVLTAGGNVAALVALCREHRPDHAAIADPAGFEALREGLR